MRENTAASRHQRSPRIAAALNLLPLPVSLGYVYLDRPLRFAVSSIVRSAATAVTWTYLYCHFIESYGIEGCPPDAGALPLMIVPLSLALALAYTTLDARSVAVAHGKSEYPPARQMPRRRAGAGTLTIMGALALLALGALRTGDAVSFVLIVVVASGGWLTWRQGHVRLPDDYRPPDEPEGPPTE